MADTPTKRPLRRLIVGALVGVFLLGATVTLGWYLGSAGFGELVRERVISELEDATGGRVDLRSLHWNIYRLELEADDLTVHGLEPASDAPLARIGRLHIKARIISLLRRQVDLTYLEFQQPQVHLIVQPDGKTNVPQPKQKSGADPMRQLFDLAIGRVELSNGLLQLNDQVLPMDFLANDVAFSATFDQRDKRYDAKISVGKIAAKYRDYRELPLSAEAEFSAWETHAQVKRLQVQSQRSTLEAKGTVDNFSGPSARFEYVLTLDLPQAGAVARTTLFRKGTASLSGSGSYDASKYALSGKLSAREVNYSDVGVQLVNTSLTSDFRADNAGLQLDHLMAHLLGGQLSGAVEIKNAGQGAGQVQFKMAGVSLAEAARSFSTPAWPLEKFKLAGNLQGDVSLAWKGEPSRGNADFTLYFVPPAEPEAGRLAPSGTVRGSYSLSSGILELRPLQLATAATQLYASGRMGARVVSLNLSLATNDLNEIEGVLNTVGQPSLPLDLAGTAKFTGTVDGKMPHPEIQGNLQASDFTYLYTSSPGSSSPAVADTSVPAGSIPSLLGHPKRIHFDSLVGDIFYSNSRMALRNAVIRRADATLNLSGSATLHDGDFTDDSQLELQCAVQEGDASRFQEIIGTDYPVTGKVNLALKAAGTRASPNGRGTFSLKEATVWGRPLDSLTSDIVLRNGTVALSDVRLKAPGGTVQGSGSYDLNTHQMLADLRSDDIELAKVPELQLEKLTTSGVATLNLHASGTPEIPIVTMQLRVHKLVLNEEHVGDLSLDANTRGNELVVTGRSAFEHASLTLDGTVGLQDNLPGKFDLAFNNLDIDPFLSSEIKGRITAHSAVAGAAHLAGPLRQPKALTGSLKIDEFHSEIEKIPVQSEGPIELVLANQTLSVKQFVMSSQDTRLQLTGNLHFDGNRAVDVQADGSINAALLQTFDPDLTASGKAVVNVRVEGTLAKPVMTGRVEIAHVSLSNIDLPAALADVNGALVFNESRLEIEKLTGRVGGGAVEFAGYIGYSNAITFNITSQGNDIRFRYSGISLTANQNLKLQGTLKNATVSGDITITRFAQIPSADLAAAFANASPPVPDARSPLNNLHLDVHIRSAPELTVQTTLAKLSGEADLRVRGTALRPILLGRVNLAQGDLKINGTKYYLERGDITFANPVRIDPILDVEATTRVRDYDITIGLHGTMERLLTTYRSDPPLSSEDIISLLAFGRTQTENALGSSGTGGGLGEAGGSALVGAAINQAVSNRVSRLFGVSAIRINPAAGGPDNNPNARLTVEQQVSSDVTITYITNLARSAQQVLQFEYNITRDYTINAIRDENGVVSFDLLIRKRRK